MKTLIVALFYGILSSGISSNAFADGDTHYEPTRDNCNTQITNTYAGQKTPNFLKPDEETYVDDIPFSTSLITSEYKREEAIRNTCLTSLDPETYADDIPFNTSSIARKAELSKLIPDFQPEPYADDIPFDTKQISDQALSGSLPTAAR